MWDAIKNAVTGSEKAPSPAELRAAQYRTELDLAFRYGTRLPKPKPPKLSLPAFWVGPCEATTFSPSGDHIVVPTSNGDFLWHVATGTKGPRLKGVSNQRNFVFTADGRTLLARNENSQFAIFSIPDGELLRKFDAKYKFRMDGRGTLAGDADVVLQLAYGGQFLMLDACTGKVLLTRQLEPTGCDGQIHWLPGSNMVIVTQSSVSSGRIGCEPCAIFRWQWPLDQHEPERIPGTWNSLSSEIDRDRGLLLLHHQRRGVAHHEAVLERLRISDWTVAASEPCANGILPMLSVSHDQRAFAVRGDSGLEIRQDGQSITTPITTGGAAFHPSRDLVAVSGLSGFVAPLSTLASLAEHLQVVRDSEILNQRGYARGTSLPNGIMPRRVVVWRADDDRVLLEREANFGRLYLPISPCLEVTSNAELGPMLMELSCSPAEAEVSDAVRRQFQVGPFTPPGGDFIAGVAVTFATDAIELWPLKPESNNIFRHHWYPVAALAPDSNAQQFGQALLEMLGHYKPRNRKK